MTLSGFLLHSLVLGCNGPAETEKGSGLDDSGLAAEPSLEPTDEPSGEPADEGGDTDADQDGYTPNDGDCDDFNNTVYPGASEVPDDGIDQDCNGEDSVSVVVPEEYSLMDVDEGDLIITEVMKNPSAVGDEFGEWFEVYNNLNARVNLNGLGIGNLDGVDFTIDSDIVIESGAQMVFGVNDDSELNGGIDVDVKYFGLNLSDDADSVAISYNGSVIDGVEYDGESGFPSTEGKSLNLDPGSYGSTDNDDGSSWCDSLNAMPSGDFATPGQLNNDCPLPSENDGDGDGYDADTAGGSDCDDGDPSINPGAVDVADDGIDQDCDGNDSVSTGTDADGDGFDSVASGGTDCDDSDPAVNPDALDIGQDGIDQDCSGGDEVGLCSDNCSTAEWNDDGFCDDGGPDAEYYACGFGADCSDCGPRYDMDGDGHYDDEGGVPFASVLELDCNDSDSSIFPDATDFDNDGVDQDCSGSDFTSGICTDDGGYPADGECDDGGPNASYAAVPLGDDCTDCGPRYDLDGDGYYDDEGVGPLDTSLSLDCDDEDGATHPEAAEIIGDGVDQDCDGADELSDTTCSDDCEFASDGTCDDGGTGSVTDVCDLGTDCSDCGERYDLDGDGYDNVQDCDDTLASVSPGVMGDACDGIDNDCDGAADEDADPSEPTSWYQPIAMGSLDISGDSVSSSSVLTHESDTDAFSFYFYDHPDLPPDDDDFSCIITPPNNVDIAVELLFNGTSLGMVDSNGTGLAEEIIYDGIFLIDDEGIYTVVVTSYSGSDCSNAVAVTCNKP
jgi:hypothetical protein